VSVGRVREDGVAESTVSPEIGVLLLTKTLVLLRCYLSKTEVSDLLGISPKTVEHYLRELRRERKVESTEASRGSKNTRYRLTAEGEQGELFS